MGNSTLKKMVFPLDASAWHRSATETAWVESLESGNFRVENSLFYAFGVSYRDIVKGRYEGDQLFFDGVVSRSGHSTYRIIKNNDEESLFSKYWMPLQEIGCTYEEGLNGLLSVDVPLDTDIFAAYKFLELGETDGIWSFEEAHCGRVTD